MLAASLVKVVKRVMNLQALRSEAFVRGSEWGVSSSGAWHGPGSYWVGMVGSSRVHWAVRPWEPQWLLSHSCWPARSCPHTTPAQPEIPAKPFTCPGELGGKQNPGEPGQPAGVWAQSWRGALAHPQLSPSGFLPRVTTRQCSQLLGLIELFIVHVHLFNTSGPNGQRLPKRNYHPSFYSCGIMRSYFTDMMSLLRNKTFYFQKVFINAEGFLRFFSSGLARTSGAGKLQSPEIFTRRSKRNYNPQYSFERERTDNNVGNQQSQPTAKNPSAVERGRGTEVGGVQGWGWVLGHR